MWFNREKTPDEELALRVRKAADEYNAAVKAATAAKLRVSATMKYQQSWSSSTEYVSDQIFGRIDVSRTNRKEF